MKKQIKHYAGGREGIYDPRYDAYEGGTLPGITVTGTAPKKGLYPVRLRFNPNKWATARTKQFQPSEMMAPLSLAAEAINEVPVIGPAFNRYVAPALSVGNWIVGGGNPYEGMELRANDERLLGGWLPLDFAGPKIIGSAISKAATSSSPLMQYVRYPIGKMIYGLDAQFPTLYRKVKAMPKEPENGKVQISNPDPRFAFESTGEQSPTITNFTYDAPVRRHSSGNWDPGYTLAMPGRKALLGKNVVSTEPSDLFTYGDNIKMPLKDVTLISGDLDEIAAANRFGYNAHTTPELQALHAEGYSPGASFVTESGRRINLRKEDYSKYAKQVELETRKLFKSPTKKDVDFMNFVLRPQIRGKVYSPAQLDQLIRDGIEPFGDRIGNAQLRNYLLDPDRWENILYDPATHAEANFRKGLGIVEKKDVPRNVINDFQTTANVSHTTNPRQYVSPQSSQWMDAQTLEPTMTTDWSARDLFRQDRINSLYTPEEIASNRRFFERMSDETTIPKGFVEGNEQAMPTQAMVPVEEAGLSVRNANPINLENPVMNPAERQAALDFLKENPQMRGQIETKVRPGVAEEDWRYPHETMVEHGLRKPTVTTNKYTKAKKQQQEDLTKNLSRSYGPSQQIGFSENWDFSMDRTRFERLQKTKGEVAENVEQEPPKPVKPPKVKPPKKTLQQRSKEYHREKMEDREQGVFKRQRRQFNQAHALEDGDMRHANSGRPSHRQIANAEQNIEKYPLYEQRQYEKVRKRLARRGYTTEEMSRSPEMKDFLEGLIGRHGNF